MSPRRTDTAGASPAARSLHLNRLLSKRGILTRSQATAAILDGRVTVNDRVVRDPAKPVDASARIEVDGRATTTERPWRAILFHKPRGVMTTRRDPQGRPTIYEVIGAGAQGLIPVGRLDQATSGLLLLTSDTALADRITDPRNNVPRIYTVTVRGQVTRKNCDRLEQGLVAQDQLLKAHAVTIRKSSSRESHLTMTLTEGKNREIRRLFEAVGHEVTRLKRVALGGLTLGDLDPGQWRELTRSEMRKAFPALS
jgi:23S rRNA pseudouridine2605 synthase